MWQQFFAQNAHFAINLGAALVSMGICWLYLDAWTNHRDHKELFRWTGFGMLAISFLLQATVIEQSVLGKSLLGNWSGGLMVAARLIAYAAIIIGQLIDPLQVVPKNPGLVMDNERKTDKKIRNSRAVGVAPFFSFSVKLFMPVGALAISMLYWRRATQGLERHLRPVAKAFLLFAISDLVALAGLLRGTSNPVLYTWVSAFGWIWWLQQLTLLAGVIILGIWIWGYLLERFFSQLYMIFTAMIMVVFLIVSVAFTGLLLRNVQSDALVNLTTAANVLNYALTAKQGETASAAEQLAASGDITAAIGARNRDELIRLTSDYLSSKKLTGLIITDPSGQVLLRGQDTEQWGDSLSDDTLVKRALLGMSQSTINIIDSVGAPTVQVRSAAVVKDGNNNIVGSVVAMLDLDSAFVDGIRQSTGLHSSIYGGDTLAATTLSSTDNQTTRPVGTKLSNAMIKDKVLKDGNAYSGTSTIQNRQMLTAYLPIKDVDNANVGMLLVAEPQSVILATAGHSVELIFLLTALILLISVLPIYYIVKSLTRQLA